MQIEELPEEILIQLFHFLHPRELCVISLLCKELNRIINDEIIWKEVSEGWWPLIAWKHERDRDYDWKQYHIHRYKVNSNWEKHKYKKFALRGHIGTVFSVKIVDDNHLVSAGEDGSLHFWDHTNKQHILGHQAHEAAIIGLEYDPVSHTAVTGASDKSIKVWKHSANPRATIQAMSIKEIKELLAKHNISSKDCFEKADLVDKALCNKLVPLVGCTHTLHGHTGAILGLHLDTKAGILASASFDQTARVWDLKNGGKPLLTFTEHRGTVNCVQLVNQQYMLTGGNDAKVLKSDITTGQVVQEFVGHIGWVWNLQYSDSSMLSCSIDHKIRLWDVKCSKSVAVLNHHTAECCGLQVNFQTNKFVSSAFDGKYFILTMHIHWDMRNLSAPLLSLSCEERCTRVTFDENMIAVATFGQVVQLFDFTK